MVTIRYLGHSCFLFTTSKGLRIIIDPYHPVSFPGYSLPSVKADIVLVTHEHYDHNAARLVRGAPFVIRGVGTQIEKNVWFIGLPSRHTEYGGITVAYQNTIYCFGLDKIGFCHAGDLGYVPEEDVMRWLKEVARIDVFMVPVGGYGHTIDIKDIPRLIDELKPRIVIPMHYRVRGLSRPGVDLYPAEYWVEATGYSVKVKRLRRTEVELKPDSLPEKTELWILQPAASRLAGKRLSERLTKVDKSKTRYNVMPKNQPRLQR